MVEFIASFQETNQSFNSEFINTVYVGNAQIKVNVVESLPQAEQNRRGEFLIVSSQDTDRLYVCMLISGKYKWVEFSASGVPELDTETAELGKAILGQMKLA